MRTENVPGFHKGKVTSGLEQFLRWGEAGGKLTFVSLKGEKVTVGVSSVGCGME